MTISNSNRESLDSDGMLQRIRNTAGSTQRETARKIKTHCVECKKTYKTLSSRTVGRYEKWLPPLRNSDTHSETIRPSPHYVIHFALAFELSREKTNELLSWAGYDPEYAWQRHGTTDSPADGTETAQTRSDELPEPADELPDPPAEQPEPAPISMPLTMVDDTNQDSESKRNLTQSDSSDDPDSPPAVAADQEFQPISVKSRLRRLIHWLRNWPYSDDPGETFPFGIYLLLLQCCMLFGGFVTGLDPYGLNRWLPGYTGSVWLFALSFAIIFLISVASTVLFYLLSNRKGGARHVLTRTVWRVIPPLVLAYIPLLLFSIIAVAIFCLVVFALFGGMFMAIVAFRDKEFRLSSSAVDSLRDTVRVQCLILGVMYVALMSVMHLGFHFAPETLSGVNESLLLGSAAIDFDSLGYGQAELIDRLRLGGLWTQLAMGVCLYGVGVYLLRTVHALELESSQ